MHASTARRQAKRKSEYSSEHGSVTRQSKRGHHSSARSTPRPSQASAVGGLGQTTFSKRVTLHPPTSHLATSSPRSLTRNATPRTSSSMVDGEDETALQEREDNDALNEIILAVDMKDRGTIGCSYYVAREEKLYFMDDVPLGGIDVIDTVKLYANPTVIIISMRVDESVDEHLDPEHASRGSLNGNDDQFRLPYLLQVRPPSEFAYDVGKRKLLDLRIETNSEHRIGFIVPGDDDNLGSWNGGQDAGFTGRRGKLLRLSGWINMESRLSVGCAGAVLAYILRRRAAEFLPGDANARDAFQVSAIETFSLKDNMFLNADALASLQVMQSESHPHIHNKGPTNATSGAKEGMSVYGLFHHLARTPQGKALLRQWFLRPSLDLNVINERLDTASVYLRPDNHAYMEEIVKSLKKIKNMKTVMIHLRKGIGNGVGKNGGIKNGVWSSLRSFAFHSMGIRKAVFETFGAERLTIRHKVLEFFEVNQLANLGRNTTEIIDFSTSAEMHRAVVRQGVNDELDELKRVYAGIEDLLNRTSQDIANHIPPNYSLDMNVIFFPQIGFLISMPIDSTYEGGGENQGRWERIFSTEGRIYYKDFRMQELDDHFGDMYANICDKEIEIVHELAVDVLRYEEMLVNVSNICGELDCLLALAQGAQMHRLSRPRVTRDNIIRIKGGRHPLQELTVPSFVPNDTFLVGGKGPPIEDADPLQTLFTQNTATTDDCDGPSMLMMTGPNYSGKSILLKQIALIVVMAHIGCFVPAERATIGLTDKVLTRIATRETVSNIQSAFMIDLQQISSALNSATHRSLVVIDEFGKGTDSADGAGLACGVFEYLLGLGDDRPKVLGATHFHEIFENGFLPPRPELAFGFMEVRANGDAREVEDQIAYLYNFRPGRSRDSFGTMCAAMNGIDPKIIKRADDLVWWSARGEDLVARCAAMKKSEEQDHADAGEVARRFLEWEFKDLRLKTRMMDVLEDILSATASTTESMSES